MQSSIAKDMKGGNNAAKKEAEGTKKEVVISANVLQLNECREEEQAEEGDPFSSSRDGQRNQWKRDDAAYSRRRSSSLSKQEEGSMDNERKNNTFERTSYAIQNRRKKKKKKNRIQMFRVLNYIYKAFTSMLSLLIVILILYASIDISTNYGPIIIVYILILEFGSMLISYILLQFPFFYRMIKNVFTRARNVNKYSHQYKPFYYDSPSNSDDKDSISIERGKSKRRRNTFALFSINRNNKRYSIKTLFTGFKSKKGKKKGIIKDGPGEGAPQEEQPPNGVAPSGDVSRNSRLHHGATSGPKRQSIYLDDCNMWMNSDMKKVNKKKKNFTLSRSLSFNMKLDEENDMMMRDSASLDNIKILLGHPTSKFVANKNKVKARKSSIYNKYVPLTFISSYKNNMVTEFLKSHTENMRSMSSEYSSSDSQGDGDSGRYKKVYVGRSDAGRRRRTEGIAKYPVDDKDIDDDEGEEESGPKKMLNREIKSHTKENTDAATSLYAAKSAILFSNKKQKKKHQYRQLIRGRTRYFKRIPWVNRVKKFFYFFINYNMKSSKSTNNIFLFFRGLSLYIKHRFMHYLSYEPVWIIAILIRIVMWCIVWLWAASYMERNPKNFQITAWNMKNVPSFYGYIECTFQWCGVFDYFFGLYFTNNKLKYIFSFFSLIDFITTPVSSLIMNAICENKYSQNYWFLILGPLRFLRLVRAESTISSCFFWLSDVKIIIIGIIILALAILFTFSGIMYILEAPDIERDFVSPLDFVYFGVITMSTVGYGDYTPVTPAGKCLTMFIIVTCISFVGAQFKRLKEAMFSPKTNMGIIPKQDDDYILILGPVSPTQLLYICKAINNSFPNSVESIFLFTPLPVVIYRFVYGSIVKNTNIKLCINGGNECFICPSIIYDAVINARALYILNNVDAEKYTLLYQQIFLASNNLNFSNNDQNQKITSNDILHNNIINKFNREKAKKWKYSDFLSDYKNEISKNNMNNLEMNININDSHVVKEKDDQECLLRFIGTYNICHTLLPITIQLSNNTYEELVKSMKVYNYLSMEELKYALLAKSINCKGLFFLIINFFYKPKAVKSLKKYIIDLKLLMYNRILKRKNREKMNNGGVSINQGSDISSISSDMSFGGTVSYLKGGKSARKGGTLHTANTANTDKVGIQHSSEPKGENKISTRGKGRTAASNYNEMLPLNSIDELDFSRTPSYRNYYYMLDRVSVNMYYYLEGLKYNIYRFQFPECMRGFLFQTATEYLYQKYSAFLIGIITINKEIFLNPVDYIIGEENKFYYTSAFSGIVLTTSLDNLIKLSSIKNISKKVYEYNDRRISERFRGNAAAPRDATKVNATKENSAGVNPARGKVNFNSSAGNSGSDGKGRGEADGSVHRHAECQSERHSERHTEHQSEEEKVPRRSNLLYNFFLGIYEVDNYISAYRDIFIEKDKPLLLVCGWPDNIHLFLKHLQVNPGNWLRHRRKRKRQKGEKLQTGETKKEPRGEQPIVHVNRRGSDISCSDDSRGDDSRGDDSSRKKKRVGGKIKYNIIILSLHVPKFNYENDLMNFSHNVAFIRGSALNSTNLIQAGVFYAKRLIIFNANHSLFIDKDAYRIDNEVIIIKNVIYQLYNSVLKSRFNYMNLVKKVFKKEIKAVNINEKVFASDAPFQLNEMIRVKKTCSSTGPPATSSLESSAESCASSSASSPASSAASSASSASPPWRGSHLSLREKCKTLSIFNINRNPYLICLIKNSESLEYIDGSINLSYENYNDNEKMNKIWENCGEYIYTFELVSANIFVDEMLHNLVSFSLPISKYAIEYSVIYSLIGIDINEYSKNAKAFHKNLKLCTGQVNLIPIPSYFYKKSFYKCFSYFLHNKQCLCIGILRYMDISPLCKTSRKLFVLSCPSRTMKIERDDQAYVISYNMK
ncbi:hypothetical protein C922_00816 [Plasmodium inui San Antonio 1]|uniref:Uncharacterized protein n=1 Tax=Plasmodium inui San Antonio 1 TaxID=1237626 RepID=W7AJV9_9APIC|nr:hypothetical protein C922_00816 [Plasmodium inui San Antonio 1]EUD69124.1 hypothetical protein C922_00816 [Plasmodium inui San Antonio 1]